jgi:hypothetical protein
MATAFGLSSNSGVEELSVLWPVSVHVLVYGAQENVANRLVFLPRNLVDGFVEARFDKSRHLALVSTLWRNIGLVIPISAGRVFVLKH